MKLLSAIDNIKSVTIAVGNIAVPIINYHSKSRFILLNDWENPFYFPMALLILFFFRDGRWLKNKQQPVLIKA